MRHQATSFAARYACILSALVGILSAYSSAQVPGDCVTLSATHPAGVPVHDRPENSFRGVRIADGAIASVVELAEGGHWLRLQAGTTDGWVVSRYIGTVVPCPDTDGSDPPTSVRIGTWNL